MEPLEGWRVLRIVPGFRHTVNGMTRPQLPACWGRFFNERPTEAALLCFLFFQGSFDLLLLIQNGALDRIGLAGSGAHSVKLHGPLKAGWTGCLDDLILDAFVFHFGATRRLTMLASSTLL
jgi:hypothetical protein